MFPKMRTIATNPDIFWLGFESHFAALTCSKKRGGELKMRIRLRSPFLTCYANSSSVYA